MVTLTPSRSDILAPAKADFGGTFEGKRVVVTGHTGFKGSWLCEWLLQLGAEVTGFALPPPTTPALFEQLGLASRVRHNVGDVRDADAVNQIVETTRPDFVFHLAAQPLVRRSYAEPVETFATNIMGTAHVLEAVRLAGRSCIVIVVTTDKCYENREWLHGYREEDPLGGHDPYSASKAASELVVGAYRRSFFSDQKPGVTIRLASARAGNVIGGGDWAPDRIIPDCLRTLQLGRPIPVRNRNATRPWQHVLEPLSGYLWLAAKLAVEQGAIAPVLNGAFNFGPALTSNRTVAELVEEVLKHWPGTWQDKTELAAVHEAQRLHLATDKAHHLLGWRPVWSFEQTVARTVQWYREVSRTPGTARDYTRRQIREYGDAARCLALSWAGTPAEGAR